MPALTKGLVRPRTTDIATTLSWYRHGHSDPTTWLKTAGRGSSATGEFVRATITPEGPATIEFKWGAQTSVRQFGPGGNWLADRLPAMLGVNDTADHCLEQANGHVSCLQAANLVTDHNDADGVANVMRRFVLFDP